ncbi:MAG: SPL family radical SAM protein [bacterium]
MEVILRRSSSLLNQSVGESFFTLNPYVGCEHNCRYCYSVYISRWRHRKIEEWGSWVEVKLNAPQILKREMGKYKRGEIFVSTVCDAYQPVEEIYQITRGCLLALSDSDFSLFLLTKSERVLRDREILEKLPNVKVCFSLTTLRDEIARAFEPHSSPPSHRLRAGLKLKEKGIEVGILINPILPFFTERELEAIVDEAEKLAFDFIGFDTLHYINSFVGGRIREIYNRFGEEAMERLDYARNPQYEGELREKIMEIIKGRKIRCDISF